MVQWLATAFRLRPKATTWQVDSAGLGRAEALAQEEGWGRSNQQSANTSLGNWRESCRQ